jgi:hypothetical protein
MTKKKKKERKKKKTFQGLQKIHENFIQKEKEN